MIMYIIKKFIIGWNSRLRKEAILKDKKILYSMWALNDTQGLCLFLIGVVVASVTGYEVLTVLIDLKIIAPFTAPLEASMPIDTFVQAQPSSEFLEIPESMQKPFKELNAADYENYSFVQSGIKNYNSNVKLFNDNIKLNLEVKQVTVEILKNIKANIVSLESDRKFFNKYKKKSIFVIFFRNFLRYASLIRDVIIMFYYVFRILFIGVYLRVYTYFRR